MTEVNHHETQNKHEAMYRKTVSGVIEAIDTKRFAEHMIPRHITQVKVELRQCVDLLLISPEFYEEQMKVLEERMMVGAQS